MNLGTAVGYLELDTSKFQSGLKTAKSQFEGFGNSTNKISDKFKNLGNSFKSVGSTLTKSVTLPLTALGSGAVTVASNFEKGMSQVAATMGMTAEEINGGSKSFEKLKKAAMDAGKSTQFSASESAEALNYLALAGYDAEKSIETLPTVLNLAASGGLELGYAADIMTDAMSSLGLSTDKAEYFVDQLAKTASKSNTSVGQLGEAILTVGGTAKVLAGGTTELNTALGILADNGIKGAEGGTALRNIILALTPSTDKAVAAFEKLGVKTYDANGNLKPINETFSEMNDKLKNLSQEEKTRVLSDIFNKVDLKSVNALLANSGERFDELSGYIANADGAASDMAETMNNNLSGQLTLLKSALEGAGIAIGNALLPIIKKVVGAINGLVDWFNNLSPSIQNVITYVGLFLAALGPLLLIVGNIVIFIVNLSTAIGSLVAFFSAGGAGAAILGSAITALSGPIGWAIAAIVALIAVGVLLYKNWDEIKAKCSEIWEGIKKTISNAFDWICDIIGVDSELIKTTFTETWEKIKEIVSVAWDIIKVTIGEAWDSIKEIIDVTVGQIFVIVSEAWENIKDALSMVGDAIKQLIDGDWEGAKETIRQMNEKIKEIISMAWARIKVVLSQAGEAIKEVIKAAWNKVKVTISQTLDNIKSAVKNAWNKVKGDAETGWNNIKNAIKTIVKGIAGDIGEQLKKAWDTAKEWWNKIKNIFSKPISAVVNIFKKEKSLVAPPKEDTTTYTNSLKARENTVNDFKNGMSARTYTMYKNSEIDLKMPTIKDDKSSNDSNGNIEVNLNIDKFVNSSKEDINELMNRIAFELKKRKVSYGGV